MENGDNYDFMIMKRAEHTERLNEDDEEKHEKRIKANRCQFACKPTEALHYYNFGTSFALAARTEITLRYFPPKKINQFWIDSNLIVSSQNDWNFLFQNSICLW